MSLPTFSVNRSENRLADPSCGTGTVPFDLFRSAFCPKFCQRSSKLCSDSARIHKISRNLSLRHSGNFRIAFLLKVDTARVWCFTSGTMSLSSSFDAFTTSSIAPRTVTFAHRDSTGSTHTVQETGRWRVVQNLRGIESFSLHRTASVVYVHEPPTRYEAPPEFQL